MSATREPLLNPVPLAELRPTQITVGFREVAAKRRQWRKEHGDTAALFLGKHMIPVVAGPKGRFYVTDHHHLGLALYEEGVKDVLVTVQLDLGELDPGAFWIVMDNLSLTHPFNEDGERCAYSDIPKSLDKLRDDPFRSLAGELRLVGGYSKETKPFSEFLWADYLRRRIKRRLVEADFDKALEKAIALSKELAASYLPGWCGPVSRS